MARNKTVRRKHAIKSRKQLECAIAMRLLSALMMVKLFHWKTSSFATHKATDDLYTKLNANTDSFIEILLGKSGGRLSLPATVTIPVTGIETQPAFQREIEDLKNYLVRLNEEPRLQSMTNTDLFNIRDAILGDLNQLLYLLTFK